MKRFFKTLLLVFLFIIYSCGSQGSLETLKANSYDYVMTSESDLATSEIQQNIEEFYNNGQEGTFEGAENIPIYYKIFKHSESTGRAILISSGRTESAVKYKEICYDLFQNGYDVYIHDHRGQGFSGRMVEDRELGYVDDFTNYIIDMKSFYKIMQGERAYDKIYLLGHSMGGAIGLNYLQNYPNDFTAAAFSSPMLGLNFIQCATANNYDFDQAEYAPTQKPYDESKEVFKTNTLTNSETRFNVFYKAYNDEPLVRLGGVSLHWVNESCIHMKAILENSFKLQTPSLLFSAEEEEIVVPEGHYKFIEKCTKENVPIKGYYVKNAKHELLIEKDETRSMVVGTILNFFEEN